MLVQALIIPLLNLNLVQEAGSGGRVQVITYGNDPANIAQNQLNIDLNKNIQRYWTLTEHDGFSLGTVGL